MQSTGQTSTQELSLVPMHGSAITYAIEAQFYAPRSSPASAANSLEVGDLRGAAECRLHLRRNLQQRVLAERLRDQLRGGREPVVTEADGHADRRLAGDVEQRSERGEAGGAF